MAPLASALLALLALLAGAHAYDNGLGATPPMGWNTWCTDDLCGALDFCSEAEIRSIADAIVAEGLDKLGYEYVNMDDCWSATTRNASGFLQPNPDLFPSGMRNLSDYVHARGLKLGLYTCVGTETCRRHRPGSFGYWQQDAAVFAEWGIDFVKADFCHRPSGATATELYGNFSAALNATGRPILFSLCNWGEDDVEEWGAEFGQMFRIQMDHLPFWHFPPKAAGVGFGQGVVDIINFVGTLSPSKFSRPFGWMDPDFLMTLFPVTITAADSRSEFSFWSLWSAPLLVATDVRHLNAEKRAIIANEEIIAIDQDPLFHAGELVRNNSDGSQIWHRPLANGDSAVILFNPTSHGNLTISFDWSDIGVSPQTSLRVRDLWAHADLGVFTQSFEASVGVHDVAFLRLSVAQ